MNKVEIDKILFSQKDKESGKVVTKELPFGLCLWSTGVGLFALLEGRSNCQLNNVQVKRILQGTLQNSWKSKGISTL